MMPEPRTCARKGCGRVATRLLILGGALETPVCEDHQQMVHDHFSPEIDVVEVTYEPASSRCGICGQELWSGGISPSGGRLPHHCHRLGGEGDHVD